MAAPGTLDEGQRLGRRKEVTKGDPDTTRAGLDETELECEKALYTQRTGFHGDMDALFRGMDGHML